MQKTYETGSSDFHKLVVSIMKFSYKKRPPHIIKCRDYKNFSNEHFKSSFNENFASNTELDYNRFEEMVLNLYLLRHHLKKNSLGKSKGIYE